MRVPQPGQLLIRVASTGVNFSDLMHRRGLLGDGAGAIRRSPLFVPRVRTA